VRLLIVLFNLFGSLFSLGQETKFILKEGNGFTEEFYILRSDKNTRHGTYVKYRLPFGQVVVIEAGTYSNGKKHGLWEIFYNETSRKTWNAIKEKGQYQNGKKEGIWSFYYLDTVSNVTNVEKIEQKNQESINVSVDQGNAKLRMIGSFMGDKRIGEWMSWDRNGELLQKYNFSTDRLIFEETIKDSLNWNINRKPLFVGGEQSLSHHLASNMNLSLIDKRTIKNDSIHAVVSFVIDAFGKTTDISVTINFTDKALIDELIRLIKTTDLFWVPKLKDGIKSESFYKLNFNLIRTTKFPPNSSLLRIYFTILN